MAKPVIPNKIKDAWLKLRADALAVQDLIEDAMEKDEDLEDNESLDSMYSACDEIIDTHKEIS
jgi:hypothetical protein